MTKLKVDELRKAIFDNKQKLIRGEFKDTSFFKKTRKEIARLLSGVVADAASAVKVAKPKKEKVADAVVATEATADAPKKTKKAKAKKEEQ